MFRPGSFPSESVCSKPSRSKPFRGLTIAAAFGIAVFATTASANPFFLFAPGGATIQQYAPPAAVMPHDEGLAETSRFKRQIVDYRTNESAGTVIVDTPHTYRRP